jgi:Transposase IS116/IS110/IS902 family
LIVGIITYRKDTLMNDAKYIGLDVHQATISVAVLDSTGKLVMEGIFETKAETVLQFINGLRRKHQATKLLRQIPSIGPIRAALLLALIQTPHRFRTKRQLWSYRGLALETRTSGEYRIVHGQLQRSRKILAIRGLNKNHNHDLKNIFKGAAIRAAAVAGPFQEFYDALLAKGMKPPMARLTLARKIAAITLLVWKKGVRFDAGQLKPQAA